MFIAAQLESQQVKRKKWQVSIYLY